MDGVAEILQTCEEAFGLSGFGPMVEVIGAEVVTALTAEQHVVGDGEDRGERANRLLAPRRARRRWNCGWR